MHNQEPSETTTSTHQVKSVAAHRAPGGLLLGALGVGLVAMCVALILGLRVVAISTLPHIVVPGEDFDFLEAANGLPIPRLLDWNQDLIELLLSLRALSGPMLGLVYIVLFGALWLLAVTLLNPTFRLFHADHAAPPGSHPQPQPAFTPAPSNDLDDVIPMPLDPGDTTEQPETEQEREEERGKREETSPSNAQHPTPNAQRPPLSPIPALLTAGVEMSRLGKPLLMLLVVGLPLTLLWVILGWFAGAFGNAGIGGVFLALWLVVGGMALWVGFAREGYAGDFTATDWGTPDTALPGLLLRGALFGLGLFGLLQWAVPGPLDDLLNRLQMLGTFHRGTFAFIAGNYLLRMAGVGFAAGTLLYLLGRANLAVGRRVALLALPLVGVVIAVLPQRAVAPSRLAARLDITPQVLRAIPNRWTPRMPSAGTPDGAAAAQELAQHVHLSLVSGAQTKRPERSLLFFHGDHIYDLRQSLVSEDGFPLDAAARERVRTFLQQRDYWTALSGVAIKQLLDASVTDFDPTAALDVCLQDETHYPHLARIQHTQQALFFVSSASPQNRSLLDRFADDHLFAYPDRESLRMMGDLYNRIGAIPQAEAWYHRAEMPHSFFAIIHQYPVFHQGRISGRLLLNGHPLAGVRVGLLPKRLNGLPRDMQGLILSVDQEFLGIAQTGPAPFSPFHPRPYAFRWLSAGTTTDAQGAFALPDLIEGQYFLVVALPSNLQLTPPVDPALHIGNAPGPVVLSAAQPSADLGTISLSYSPSPGKR